MNVNRNVSNLTPIHLLYNEKYLTVAKIYFRGESPERAQLLFDTFNKFAEKERTKPVSLGQTF